MPRYVVTNRTRSVVNMPQPVGIQLGPQAQVTIDVEAVTMDTRPVKALIKAGTISVSSAESPFFPNSVEIPTVEMDNGGGGGGPPSGPAGGQLGGTYPNPDVRGIRETAGPTLLSLGNVADGEFLRRDGATIIGAGAAALTSTVFPINVTKASAIVGVSPEAARADHKHDVVTDIPVAIANANSEGAALSLARSDHTHALGGTVGGQLSGSLPNPNVIGFRETGGPTNLTIGSIQNGKVLIRSGTTVVGSSGSYYAPSATDPSSPAPQAGDTYYNTAINELMYFDGARSRWLSVSTCKFYFGRNGSTAAGTYYRGTDSRVLSATDGLILERNAVVTGLGYVRTNTLAATFQVTENGTSVVSLASSSLSGVTNTLNADLSISGILAARNAAGGATTTNVQGWVNVKWRVP